MNRKIRMIGLDLDGTLLNERKELTDYNKTVLLEAVRQGVTVLAATGRPLAGVPEEVRNVAGMRYVLTANGARVIDQQEDKILFEELIELEDAGQALDILSNYDTIREFFYQGGGYIEQRMIPHLSEYIMKEHMQNYIVMTRNQVPHTDRQPFGNPFYNP